MADRDTSNHSDYSSNDFVEQDVRQYFFVLKRNWLPASLIFLLCAGLSGMIALYLNRATYRANGQLLFQVRNPQSELTGLGGQLGELESIGRSNPLETQANLLQSRSLLNEVIETLNLRGELDQPVSPESVKRNLSVEQIPEADILDISYVSPDPERAAAFVNELMRAYLAFSAEVQQTQAATARQFVDDQLPLLEDKFNQASKALQEFKSENQILSLDLESGGIAALMTDFNQKESDARVQLAAANAQAANLRQQLNVDPAAALNLATVNDAPGVQEVLAQIQAAETELAAQRALYQPGYPTVDNLQRQLDNLNQLLQERISEALGGQAQISREDLQLSGLKQNLLAELVQVESERLALQDQLETLQALRASYQTRADAFPAYEDRQRQLEQALTNAQAQYEQLLASSQQIDLAQSQLVSSNQVQIIEEADIPDTSLTQLDPKILIAGIGAGLFLAIAAAFALDLLDPSVKTVKELEKRLGYPLLGIIPDFKTEALLPVPSLERGVTPDRAVSPRIVALSHRPEVADEAYQRVHAALRLANLQQAPRVIAVTSSVQGEGKSEVAANLAATMAQAGRRVLLVDADLRAPSQHQLWKLQPTAGLSHILMGSAQMESALQAVTSQLDVIAAGETVADPFMLLESAALSTFVQTAAQRYDYVIFDTPPAVPVPDTLILAKSCEAILFVARPKHVEVTSVLAAKSLLNQSKLPVVGFVANRVRPADVESSLAPFAGGYGRQGYGYGYAQNRLNGERGEAKMTKTNRDHPRKSAPTES